MAIQKLPSGDGPGRVCRRFKAHMAGKDGWLAWLSPRWHRQGRQGHRIRVGTDGAADEEYWKCSVRVMLFVCVCLCYALMD